jgi:hypothetical protein
MVCTTRRRYVQSIDAVPGDLEPKATSLRAAPKHRAEDLRLVAGKAGVCVGLHLLHILR